VHLGDKNPEQLERASNEIQRLRNEWPLSSLPSDRGGNTEWGTANFTAPEKLGDAVQQSWLAIECVPESRPLKKAIIKELDELAPPHVIVASNSSSYTILEILEGLSLRTPGRFASIHSCRFPWPLPSLFVIPFNICRLATRNIA
jgi:3-hydroxyacyl-CoA dehydrogenase